MDGLEYFYQWQHPQDRILYKMATRGVRVDSGFCEDLAQHAEEKMDALAATLPEINWRSPKQVAEYLYDELGLSLPPVKGTMKAVSICDEGERPTADASLHWLGGVHSDHRDMIDRAREWRKLSRLKSFAESLPGHLVKDRVHPILTAKTKTGRLACSTPNLQNQPPDIRGAFVPTPGYVMICRDYAALEWRILAHILMYRYGDTSLYDDVKANIDPHGATAVRMFDLDCHPNDVKATQPALREISKTLNYSINYGKTAAGLGWQIRDEHGNAIGTERAQEYLDMFYAGNPGIERFHEDIKKIAYDRGYVTSLLGRRRYLKNTRSKVGWKRRAEERRAMNVIQDCAADIVTVAMVVADQCQELRELGTHLLLQIHDELLFETPEGTEEKANEIITEIMDNSFKNVREFCCPLTTSGGVVTNWGEGH